MFVPARAKKSFKPQIKAQSSIFAALASSLESPSQVHADMMVSSLATLQLSLQLSNDVRNV
jgi:hypothetical protein